MENTFTNPQIALDSLPRYEDLDFTPISLKYRTLELLRWGITSLILIGIFVAVWILSYDLQILILMAVIMLVYLALRLFIIWKRQKSYGFALRERDIAFTRGYLISYVTVIPFGRIQHVSTSQGILEKMLNISTLHIFTAGGSGSDINIPGLEPDLAKNVKDALVIKVDDTP